MKFCSDCGEPLVMGARFCSTCGAALATAGQPGSLSPSPEAAAAAIFPTSGTPPSPGSAVPGPAHTLPTEAGVEERQTPNPRDTPARPEAPEPQLPPSPGPGIAGVPDPKVSAGNPTPAESKSRESSAGAAPAIAPVVPDAFKKAAEEPVNLPPAPVVWPFRESLSVFADSLAVKVVEALGQKDRPADKVITRIVQGMFCHRAIYREAAVRSDLTNEALAIAAGLLVASAISLLGLGFGAYSPGLLFVLKLVIVRVAAWVAAILAIQVAAKTLHQIDLPPAGLFRALIFAQAIALFAWFPAIGLLIGLWALLCLLAALIDVTGHDLSKAIVLLVIGGVASAVVAIVVGWIVL